MSYTRIGRGILYRIKADYLIRSRRHEYHELLGKARSLGYSLLSLVEFYDLIKKGAWQPNFRCVVLRHDIDVCNIAGNKMFHQMELEHGAHATYYFRLSTAPRCLKLIELLLEQGFEVGYHFEEPATVAKRRHLNSRRMVFSYLREIIDTFRENCHSFRTLYNPQLRSVCSHGDWINRKLGFINNEFLNDNILAECGLSFEAYQNTFKSQFDVYVSDVATSPAQWTGGYSLDDAFADRKDRVYMLTHEHQWYPALVTNTVANLNRAWETLRYRLKF